MPVIALAETSVRRMFTRSTQIIPDLQGETAVGIAGTGVIQVAIMLIGGALDRGTLYLLGIKMRALMVIAVLISFLVGTMVNDVLKIARYLHGRDEPLPPEMADIDPDKLVQYGSREPA